MPQKRKPKNDRSIFVSILLLGTLGNRWAISALSPLYTYPITYAATRVLLFAGTNDSNSPKGQTQNTRLEGKSTLSKPSKGGKSTKPSRRYRDKKQTTSLNSEIFGLRKRKNGILLAERRLDAAVEQMSTKKDDIIFGGKDDSSINNIGEQLPDEVSFNAVIGAHARNSNKDSMAPQKAEQLLRRMQELSDTFPQVSPSIFTFNSVMEAYAKSVESKNKRRKQQSQLAILRLFEEAQEFLTPNAFTFNLVLASNVQSSNEWQALEKWALGFLDGKSYSIEPDRQTYNQLLKCYVAFGDADKSENLLNKMIEAAKNESKREKSPVEPGLVWFNMVLKALAKETNGEIDPSAGERSDKLLLQMHNLAESGFTQLLPDTSTYNHVLNVHALGGNTERAEALEKELETVFKSNTDKGPSPDRITFTTLIKAYAVKQKVIGTSADTSEIAADATKVFQRMKSLSNAGWPDLSPNIVTYNMLISIWTQVGNRDALNMAMQLLREMRDEQNLLPDSITYTTLIHGWSRGVPHLSRLPEAGYRAEQLLEELEQLPPKKLRFGFSRTTVYNSVISAWSKSGEKDIAQRVDSILSKLEDKFFNGNADARPDKTTFLCMIDAYAKARIPDAEERCDALLQRMNHFREVFQFEDLEPDRAVYNAVLNALAKSFQAKSAEKAEEILTMMQSAPDEKLRPDIVTYSTVIDCHTKCGDGSRKAEELLRFVEGNYRGGDRSLEPNPVFYSAILQAWAKTATAEGAEKAEELLRRNLGLYEEGYEYAKPHGILYNAVMDAIARSGDQKSGQRAEELLDEMEALYQAGNQEMKPSRRSFNAVMLAYRNEGDGGKKAEELLSRMEDLAAEGRYEVAPDVVSYNTVVGAIVDNGDREAADRAQALLDRMEAKQIRPDGRTYGPVIEAWLKRKDEKGRTLAELMLQQFLEKVEANKKQHTKEKFYEDEVWDVINAYRVPP